jgi:hypothetical protein
MEPTNNQPSLCMCLHQVEELVRMCPGSKQGRQTLLFSATMNTTVESLAKLSLKRPVRVGVDVQVKNGRFFLCYRGSLCFYFF